MRFTKISLCFLVMSNALAFGQGQPALNNKEHVANTEIEVVELMKCASKFFQITGITDEGFFKVKVCNGFSGHAKTEENRNLKLEEFCTNAIVKHYMDEEYNLFKEMTEAVTFIYKLQVGLNKEEKLLRAQGAMYALMAQNETLKAALLYEYEQQKSTCGFILKVE